MCLITVNNERIVLKEYLRVFKLVNSDANATGATSSLQHFYYKLDKVYSLNHDLNVAPPHGGDTCFNDCAAWDAFERMFNKNPEKELSFSELYKLIEIHAFVYTEGFHFYRTIERCKPRFNEKIAEFTVPKGSTVIYDESGLGIASSIKYDGRTIISDSDSVKFSVKIL
jgi:hypothetical protein